MRSTARILWSTLGSDYVQLDRLRDVSAAGASVATDAVAKVGEEIRFDLIDDVGSKMATGLARVARVADGTMGLAFLALGIDPGLVATLVAAEASHVVAPPPLPGSPVRRPPPLPREETSEPPAASEDDDGVLSQIEPLAVRRGVIIGIDLGTTNTCASHVVDGRPEIIPGATGTNTIPSIVSFEADGTYVVGHRAEGRQVLYPERTVYGSKRLLGRTYQKKLADELQRHFAYTLAPAPGQRFGARAAGGIVSMDTIATYILQAVRASAEAHLGTKVDAAIITVPAYFTEVQRDAVRRAAREAKLVVHRIVNEPTAAAVAYGHKLTKNTRVAVWDFGGGTFDMSIVDVRDHELEVVATGGDCFLGGADFDDALAVHLLSEFRRTTRRDFDPTPQQLARIREAAEHAKRALSVQTEYVIEIRELVREPLCDLRIEVTRAKFEELTRHLVELAVAIAKGILESGKVDLRSVDDVVLVGGTTRVPAVQKAVAELFGRRPSKRINPDEAVALGAALLADEIGAEGTTTLLDVIPMSVGRGARGHVFEALVPRHHRLPASRVVMVEVGAEGRATLPLFQGEARDVRQNEYIGSAIAPGLAPRGRVSFKISFDEHCSMVVEAEDAKTKRALPIEMDRTRPLSDVLADLG